MTTQLELALMLEELEDELLEQLLLEPAAIEPNPLSLIPSALLTPTQTSLGLMCLRSKSSTRRKHAAHGCLLMRFLKLESRRRGLPEFDGPYRA